MQGFEPVLAFLKFIPLSQDTNGRRANLQDVTSFEGGLNNGEGAMARGVKQGLVLYAGVWIQRRGVTLGSDDGPHGGSISYSVPA